MYFILETTVLSDINLRPTCSRRVTACARISVYTVYDSMHSDMHCSMRGMTCTVSCIVTCSLPCPAFQTSNGSLVCDFLRDSYLQLTQSKMGFISSVHYRSNGDPYLKSYTLGLPLWAWHISMRNCLKSVYCSSMDYRSNGTLLKVHQRLARGTAQPVLGSILPLRCTVTAWTS